MTREEIEGMSKTLNCLLDKAVLPETRRKLNEKLKKIGDLAIKALEKEAKTDILDKIRAEIESKMETVIVYDMASYKSERNKAREECIEIIDKYRQEVGE